VYLHFDFVGIIGNDGIIIQLILRHFPDTGNWIVEDNQSSLTTEKVEIYHRDLSTMTIQDTLNEGNGRFDPLVISLFENKLLFNM
jgi:hypothetical protein